MKVSTNIYNEKSIKLFFHYLNRYFFLVVFYIFCRLMFLVFNNDIISTIPYKQLIKAFLDGVKTDIITIPIINFIPFSISLLFFSTSKRTTWDILLFGIFNIPIIILSIIQCEYFKFIGRGLMLNIMNIIPDIKDQALSLVIYYWYIILIIIFTTYFFFKLISIQSKYSFYKIPLLIILFYSPNGISQQKEIGIQNNVLDYLTSNTFISIISSTKLEKVHKVNLVNNKIMYSSTVRDTTNHNFKHFSKPNIFLLVCESLSSECIQTKNTPFLDSLSRKGVSFMNFYANGKESIDAIPSIVSSVPKLIDSPFISYVNNSTNANYPQNLGERLKNNGYKTLFFHGARDGSMGFKKFVTRCGYENYFGLDTYPQKTEHFDGAWGIYDEYFLKYACQKISSTKQPFHCLFFTLSAHTPFNLPDSYQPSLEDQDPMHKSMRYADYSIRLFFKEAQKERWYKNTLFIITGDHTHFQRFSGKVAYKVPLIIFHPNSQEMNSLKNKVNTNKFSQHTDIFPSVLDYLNLPRGKMLPFGESIFAKNEGFVFFYNSGKYSISDKNGDYPLTKYSQKNNKKYIKLASNIQFYKNIFFEKYR